MTISSTEFNTNTKIAEIWNYELTEDGKRILSSEKVTSAPVAEWANKDEITGLLMVVTLADGRWQFGQ